jgi:hypothetical protein
MTTSDYIQIVEYEMHIGGVSIAIDRPTILTALNESAQRLFSVMITADDTLWTYSQAYGSSTTWAKSSFANYFRFRAVDGGAGILPRKVDFKEFATVQYSTVEQGLAGSPVFKEDGVQFLFAPATAGTLYAIASFGEIVNANSGPLNLTTDLTAADTGIIPWPFEEIFILGAIKILAEREMGKPGTPESDVQKLFHIAQETKAMLDAAAKPERLFRETRVTPKIPPTEQQQQAQQQQGGRRW